MNGRTVADGRLDVRAVAACWLDPTPFRDGRVRGLSAVTQRAVDALLAEASNRSLLRAGCSPDEVRAIFQHVQNGTDRMPTPEPPRLTPVRLCLNDIKSPPGEVCLLGRMIPLAKSSVLFGPQSIGKSAWIAQLALAFAAGTEQLWGLPLLPGGGAVLVYTAEDSLDDWKRKAAAIRRVGGIDVEKAIERLYVIDNSEGVARLSEVVTIRSGDPTSSVSRRVAQPTAEQDAIIEAARKIGAVLILMETASRLVEDEDNPSMAALQSALGRIARETGAAVLCSHHPTKAASKDNDPAPESARGGGAFTMNARNAISLFPAAEPDAAPYTDRFPTDDLVVLRHVKSTSSTRPEAPITLVRLDGLQGPVLMRPQDVARSPEEIETVNARLAVEREREDAQLARLFGVVADLQKVHPVSPTGLRPHVTRIGVPKRDLDALVLRAVSRGVLHSEPNPHGSGNVLRLGADPRHPVKSES